jgi:hypothetical protein
VAQQVTRRGNLHRCRYRLTEQGKSSEWREAQPIREIGGVFLYLPNVKDDHLIEVEIANGRTWTSPAIGQWLQIQLEKEAGP